MARFAMAANATIEFIVEAATRNDAVMIADNYLNEQNHIGCKLDSQREPIVIGDMPGTGSPVMRQVECFVDQDGSWCNGELP